MSTPSFGPSGGFGYSFTLVDLFTGPASRIQASMAGLSASGTTLGMQLAAVGASALVGMQMVRSGSHLIRQGVEAMRVRADLEAIEYGFSTFLGSMEASLGFMNRLRADAVANPIFDLENLAQANQLLISNGVASEVSRKTINDLANALAATGKGAPELARMAINLQQIKAIGKASQVDIKQFGYAGVPIMTLIANAAGKTVAELEGIPVTFEMISDAMSKAAAPGGVFHNALERLSQSMKGRLAALAENTKLMQADIGKAIEFVTKPLVSLLIKLTDAIQRFVATPLGKFTMQVLAVGSLLLLVFGAVLTVIALTRFSLLLFSNVMGAATAAAVRNAIASGNMAGALAVVRAELLAGLKVLWPVAKSMLITAAAGWAVYEAFYNLPNVMMPVAGALMVLTLVFGRLFNPIYWVVAGVALIKKGFDLLDDSSTQLSRSPMVAFLTKLAAVLRSVYYVLASFDPKTMTSIIPEDLYNDLKAKGLLDIVVGVHKAVVMAYHIFKGVYEVFKGVGDVFYALFGWLVPTNDQMNNTGGAAGTMTANFDKMVVVGKVLGWVLNLLILNWVRLKAVMLYKSIRDGIVWLRGLGGAVGWAATRFPKLVGWLSKVSTAMSGPGMLKTINGIRKIAQGLLYLPLNIFSLLEGGLLRTSAMFSKFASGVGRAITRMSLSSIGPIRFIGIRLSLLRNLLVFAGQDFWRFAFKAYGALMGIGSGTGLLQSVKSLFSGVGRIVSKELTVIRSGVLRIMYGLRNPLLTLANTFISVFGGLGTGLTKALGLIAKVGQMAQSLIFSMAGSSSGAVRAVGTSLLRLSTILMYYAQSFSRFLFSARGLLFRVQNLGAGVASVIGRSLSVAGRALSSFRFNPVVRFAVSGLGSTANLFKTVWLQAVASVSGVFRGLSGIAHGVMRGISSGLMRLAESFRWPSIAALRMGGVFSAVGGVFRGLRVVAVSTATMIAGAFSSAFAWMAGIVSVASTAMSAAFARVGLAARLMWSSILWPLIIVAAKLALVVAIAAAIGAAVYALGRMVRWLWDKVGDSIISAIRKVGDWLKTAWNFLFGWIPGLSIGDKKAPGSKQASSAVAYQKPVASPPQTIVGSAKNSANQSTTVEAPQVHNKVQVVNYLDSEKIAGRMWEKTATVVGRA